MKIGIMGYYPPPIGGISMHVKRLEKLLEINKIDYKIYSISDRDYEDSHLELFTNRRKWSLKYLFSKKEDIIHCHTMGWLEKAYYLVLGKLAGKKVIYTFHSFRDKYDTLGIRNRIAYKLVMRFGDQFIVVGKNDYDYIMKHEKRKNRFHYIPGFITPVDDEVPLPDYVMNFMNNHRVIISGNAANNKQYNGQDLYGIDLCVDYIISKGKDSDIGLVFLLPNIADESYHNLLLEKIKNKGVEEHFMFVHEFMELYKVIKKSTLFVRPTNTDGDAISIREALHFNIPVVASDAVTRPTGAIMFENRNFEDFCVKIDEVIEGKGSTNNISQDFGLQILDIYHKLYNE